MIYLQTFRMPAREDEESFFSDPTDPRNQRTCYTTKYPFHVFRYRQLPEFTFEPVTILYGGNGSGKSTILNVMAESLHLRRGAVYNRSDFFGDYTALCRSTHRPIPKGSRIITSDDVFDHLLDVRCINDGIDTARVRLLEQYVTDRHTHHPLKSLEDYEAWRRRADAQSMSQSRFLREHLMENVAERSNGESALAYFTQSIGGKRPVSSGRAGEQPLRRSAAGAETVSGGLRPVLRVPAGPLHPFALPALHGRGEDL